MNWGKKNPTPRRNCQHISTKPLQHREDNLAGEEKPGRVKGEEAVRILGTTSYPFVTRTTEGKGREDARWRNRVAFPHRGRLRFDSRGRREGRGDAPYRRKKRTLDNRRGGRPVRLGRGNSGEKEGRRSTKGTSHFPNKEKTEIKKKKKNVREEPLTSKEAHFPSWIRKKLKKGTEKGPHTPMEHNLFCTVAKGGGGEIEKGVSGSDGNEVLLLEGG